MTVGTIMRYYEAHIPVNLDRDIPLQSECIVRSGDGPRNDRVVLRPQLLGDCMAPAEARKLAQALIEAANFVDPDGRGPQDAVT